MPARIFTFDAKAASSQDVEKVADHNGRDQIRINDKATKLTLVNQSFAVDCRGLREFDTVKIPIKIRWLRWLMSGE